MRVCFAAGLLALSLVSTAGCSESTEPTAVTTSESEIEAYERMIAGSEGEDPENAEEN